MALSQAIHESGLSTETVVTFLQKEGYTLDDVMARGGYMRILMDMVPGEYPTYDDLVKIIKSTS